MNTLSTSTLTAVEQTDLARCEAVIAQGLQTFLEVGHALMEIRERQLYRATHGTFAAYCEARWQISRQRGYQLIDAARIADDLSTVVDTADLSERQLRPLAKLDTPDERKAAWERAAEIAGDSPRTARHVQQAVAEQRPAPAPTPPDPPAGWTWRPVQGHQLRRIADAVMTRNWASAAGAISEATEIDRQRPLRPAPAPGDDRAALALQWLRDHGWRPRQVAGAWQALRPGSNDLFAFDGDDDLVATVAYLRQHPDASTAQILKATEGIDETTPPMAPDSGAIAPAPAALVALLRAGADLLASGGSLADVLALADTWPRDGRPIVEEALGALHPNERAAALAAAESHPSADLGIVFAQAWQLLTHADIARAQALALRFADPATAALVAQCITGYEALRPWAGAAERAQQARATEPAPPPGPPLAPDLATRYAAHGWTLRTSAQLPSGDVGYTFTTPTGARTIHALSLPYQLAHLDGLAKNGAPVVADAADTEEEEDMAGDGWAAIQDTLEQIELALDTDDRLGMAAGALRLIAVAAPEVRAELAQLASYREDCPQLAAWAADALAAPVREGAGT